jgi:hypothetical protein
VVVECVKGDCDGFFTHEGYLFKIGIMCISSSSLWDLLIRETHDGGLSGHSGEKKIYKLLKKHFFWPSMLKDVRKVIKRCVVCKKAKSKENAYELYMLLPILKHLLMNIVARSHRDIVGNGRGFFRAS